MSDILNRFHKQDELEENEINETSEKYLTFLIDKQYYGFHINDVKEIIEMQDIIPVPELPIIDVRLRFCKTELDYNERTCIIILNLKEIEVGFIVDTVDEVIDIDKADIDPVPRLSDAKTRKFIEGVGKTPKKIVMLLNAQKMLNDDEIKSLELD